MDRSITPAWRRWFVCGLFLTSMCFLIWRLLDLQFFSGDFLRRHGDARVLRVVDIPVSRGAITDRRGEPLALSTPVQSVFANPGQIQDIDAIAKTQLATLLDIKPGQLVQRLRDRRQQDFVYLKRHITPDLAGRIRDLDLAGIYFQREYRRYYPAAEITSHLLGFTDIDDIGQEGLELAYDDWLRGTRGSKRVLKDRLGRVVDDIESIRIAKPGHELILSIDKRIQYLAYRELSAAVKQHKAASGALLMLDTTTGEVMAMVGQPAYNPNNRVALHSQVYRNRLVTDVFEPGSTIKPFSILAALESGAYTPETLIDVSRGIHDVDGHEIRDFHNYGQIDVTTVLTKSSNVGASKIALALPIEAILDCYMRVGFGRTTGSGYPGEVSGNLPMKSKFSDIERATLSFGYGISVSPLQLVQAYSVLANNGLWRPVSFIKVTPPVVGREVLPAQYVQQIRHMLETVVGPGGTGQQADVIGYRVAGKTGTVHKAITGGYAEDRYLSSFVGFAPASSPRLVMLVMLDDPRAGQHFGGQVAAPVFASVMAGALRILQVPPDDITAFTHVTDDISHIEMETYQ